MRSHGFARAQYCNVNQFSKQIANRFGKIINDYKGEFKTLSNI